MKPYEARPQRSLMGEGRRREEGVWIAQVEQMTAGVVKSGVWVAVGWTGTSAHGSVRGVGDWRVDERRRVV